ncbi:hypothetical protein D1871_09495 [Nakamurella silvestris]|nr:hypothetical protein D1871_09495 [Nakamurella silvestris]
MTARTFLVRGLIAGFIAGIVAFGVAYLVGEPPINAAIAIEEAGSSDAVEPHSHDDAATDPAATDPAAEAGHSHGEEAEVSRDTQSTWGLATATIIFGTALGGVLALVSAIAVGRLGRLRPAATVGVMAAVGFTAFYLVPFLKYPPNPPAVGSGDTIGARTAKYVTMLVISVVAAIVAVLAARIMARKWNGAIGVGAAIAGYGVVVLVAAKLLSPIDEVPAGFPAELLWQFRTASLTVQLALWTTLALILAGSIHAVYTKALAEQDRRELARAL